MKPVTVSAYTLTSALGLGMQASRRSIATARGGLDNAPWPDSGISTWLGRVPGLSSAELDRMQQITSLKRRLDAAIREEAYENAARIRDELQALDETV